MSEIGSIPPCAPVLTSVAEAVSASTGREWGTTHTILLVEDEPFVRNAVAEALESAGYNVMLASNAGEALGVQQSGREAIDLLLADIVMPNISGHELARTFLALAPQTEVLLMSGYEEQLIRCEQLLKGVDYLAKPFSIPTLLQRVRGLMNRRSCSQRAPT